MKDYLPSLATVATILLVVALERSVRNSIVARKVMVELPFVGPVIGG